jgi:hypothetical protein
MPQSSNPPRPWESWHVRTDLAGEVVFWTHKLDCTDDELMEAVRAGGPIARDVAEYLEARRPRGGTPLVESFKVPDSAWTRRL